MNAHNTIAALFSFTIALAAGTGCGTRASTEPAADPGEEHAPAAVQATFDRAAHGMPRPGSLERELEHGLEVWSAEFNEPGGTLELNVLSDGTLVSIEREVPVANVPAPVHEAAVRALGAEPTDVDHTRLVVYELEDRVTPNEARERYVDAFGRVLMSRTVDDTAESETPESLDELPRAVRLAITREAGVAPVESVSAEYDGNRMVHAASWSEADGARELKLLDDGTVLSLELPLGTVPARVAALADVEEPGDEGEEAIDQDEADGDVTAFERMLLDLWQVEVR